MKQGTMNILFFVLKTKLLKNGEAPVLMRITINGDYDDARIQRSVPLNLWNAAKGLEPSTPGFGDQCSTN